MEREGVSGAAGLHRGHQHHGDLADQRHHLQLSLRQIRTGRADGKTSVCGGWSGGILLNMKIFPKSTDIIEY